MNTFDHNHLESKWQRYWKEESIYKVDIDHTKPKFYVLDMFPYPSGAGLHVGHPLGYFASDIFTRYKRMKGFNVLHPMGFDAFGLPAEEYALKTGIHPRVSTENNIERYIQQMSILGFSFDWDRMVKTCDPKYYKWTQWIFIQLFEHYYDTAENKAKPIAELVQQFEQSGNLHVSAATDQTEIFSGENWNSFHHDQKEEIIMNYRLAYRKTGFVNWCEELGTVLANDQVKDGVSERGGYPVVKKAMIQWNLRITAYAERLLDGLDKIDWSESLKAIQRNWIGRSEGASVCFEIEGHDLPLEIYTTRPDTIFGATFMVIAPEHPYVAEITSDQQQSAIQEYVAYAKGRSDIDRMADVKHVSGCFTGAFAIHPFTNNRIPIYISDYVLMDYGTGAIMAVPSDDERDMRFAKKYEIEMIDVVDKTDYPGATLQDKIGKIINSDFLNGLEVKEAITLACHKIEEKGIGKKAINYKMRDVNFSRQRYWGEPFPMVYDQNGHVEPVEDEGLPVTLPDTDDFQPTSGGKSPLARIDQWVSLPNGKTRDTDTMPAVAGSSWYFLRYMDPHNDNEFASQQALQYWQDVDLYIGGAEHAVAHLLYARFWHKFLFDLGLVPTREPFKKLINQGMIQGVIEFIFMAKEKNQNDQALFYSAKIADEEKYGELVKIPVPIEFVSDYGDDQSYLNARGIEQFMKWSPDFQSAIFHDDNGVSMSLQAIAEDIDLQAFHLTTHSEVGKMSKSKYNVINPDEIVEKYGADCFRMYEMFLGPLEHGKPWDTQGIDGVSKFLRKFWQLFFDETGKKVVNEKPATPEELKILHQAIQKVTEDLDRYSFNTCVSHFMIAVNELRKLKCHSRSILDPLCRLIAPFAPHMAEELWHQLGIEESVHLATYPVFEPQHVQEEEFEYPLCINGKKRSTLSVPIDMDKEELETMAKEHDGIQKWLEGKTIRKVIIVPKRMINLVVG